MPFEEIYHLYYIKIFQFIYRISFSEQDSEDIAQEVFLSLHNEIMKNKHPLNTKAWLYRCALNKYININKKEKNVHLTNNINLYEKNYYNTIETDIIQNEQKKAIATALSKLSPKEQVLVNLYNEEFSYKEISEILEIKPTSVGKTLSRAIEKLTTYIKSSNYEELCKERRIV
ncbi:MAG TPA: RNA polymerase sigma factor [Halanaerobiales bacterium]|nr:RNA polymerase sigma factor [Halanaerobiales bacterium]